MINLRRKSNKILENDIENDVIEIKDSTLLQMKNSIIKQKNDAKNEYDTKIKKLNDQLLQLNQKQEQLNKQALQKQQIQQNNSSNKNINEGKNYKHEILCSLITNVNNDLNLSYKLSNNEILRMGRKIIDTININKNNKNLSNIIKHELKKYCLNHSKISLSQSELNMFLNKLEKSILNCNHKELSNMFNNIHNIIYYTDEINIDELEAELQYSNIDIIDEDSINNKLIIEFPKKYNRNTLKNILIDFNIFENNLHLFS